MAAPESIAIVGIGFRGPGGADSSEKLWDMLKEGRNAWSEVPSERWNGKAHYHPDIDARDASNHQGGHFIKGDVAEFDAGFFGIQGGEADAMDPQQRLLLEVAYEAFENAGVTIEELKGSDTSVFTASFTKDYEISAVSDPMTVPVSENW